MSGNSRTPIAWQHRDMNFYQQNGYGRQSALDGRSLSQGGAASGSNSDRRSSSRSGPGGGANSSRYHQRQRPGTGAGPPPPASATTDTTPTSLSSDSATETETTVGPEGQMAIANNDGRIYYTPLPPHLQQNQDGTLRSSASIPMSAIYMGGPGGPPTLDGAPCPVHHHEPSMAGTLIRDGAHSMAAAQSIYGEAGNLYMPLSVASFPARRAASVYDVRVGPGSVQAYGTLPMQGYPGGPMGPPSFLHGPEGPFSLPGHPPGMLTLRDAKSTNRSRASRKRQAASMMVLPMLIPGPPPQMALPPPPGHQRRPTSPNIPPHLMPPMMRPRPLVMPAPGEARHQALGPEPLPTRDPEKGGKSPTPGASAMGKAHMGHNGATKGSSLEEKKRRKIQCCKGPLLVMWIILGIIAFGILLATVLSITIG